MRLILILSCLNIVLNDSVDLTQFKDFWKFNGVGYSYPGNISLLTEIIERQTTSAYTNKPLSPQGEWSLVFSLKKKCQKEEENLGIIFKIQN